MMTQSFAFMCCFFYINLIKKTNNFDLTGSKGKEKRAMADNLLIYYKLQLEILQ